MNEKKTEIGIIGLGYVGFPLACLFACKYAVIGYDLNEKRVNEINNGRDETQEVASERIYNALKNGLVCTTNKELLKPCNIYIVAVPTPVDKRNLPDLSPLERASKLIGEVISAGDIVIYESTVSPGTTEEFCAPIIEQVSGLKLNRDFYLAYSPERINPGDKTRTIEHICKITSGSTPEAAERVDELYNSVLLNGTFRAASIKVAEAAKILENTQRDVNIALINEIATILNKLDISTEEVLKAAGTKWNFLPFTPGLVGGHCISVDPYYLIEKANSIGIVPRIIIEARRVNDTMGTYIVEQVIHHLNQVGIPICNSHILILGFTFKENCHDTRNTKVIDIYKTLSTYTPHIHVFDPWVDKQDVKKNYGLQIETSKENLLAGSYDAVIHCVSHDCFKQLNLSSLCKEGGVFYDVKGSLSPEIATARL